MATFQPCEITDATSDKKIPVRARSVEEVLSAGYRPPVVIVGASHSGKTTLVIDVIRKNLAKVGKIWYFTDVKAANTNETIHRLIPQTMVKDFTWENIHQVYTYIRRLNESKNVHEDVIARIARKCATTPEDSAALEKAISEINKLSSERKRAVAIEVFSRFILAKYEENNELLTQDELTTIRGLITPAKPFMLIIDDVTGPLTSMQKDSTKVNLDGKRLAVKDAIAEVFITLLTTVRHCSNLVLIALHTLNSLDQRVRKSIKEIILCGPIAAKEFSGQRINDPNGIAWIPEHIYRNKFKNGDTGYYATYLRPEEKEQVCMIKADYNNDPYEMVGDLSKYLSFIKGFDNIARNQENLTLI